MFGAVTAFKGDEGRAAGREARGPLFTENHRDGMKELLIQANLRTDGEGRTRDAKSLGHFPAARARTEP